ncbi:MAG: hypothetical protein F4Y54_03995 [Dehalococcoidia bacterium]|nr:hypothetical protein [Dehalococcoidia bacterium]
MAEAALDSLAVDSADGLSPEAKALRGAIAKQGLAYSDRDDPDHAPTTLDAMRGFAWAESGEVIKALGAEAAERMIAEYRALQGGG